MAPDDDLWPLARAPYEALRLLNGARRAWTGGVGPSWGPEALQGLAEGVRNGELQGRLWAGPSGEAIAVGLWTPGTPAGRTVTVLLDDGFRSVAPLAEFVRRLSVEPDVPPLLSIGEPIPGVPESTLVAAMSPSGWRRALRLDYRFAPEAPILPSPPGVGPLRRMAPNDTAALEQLWIEGYAEDPIERALARHEVDPAGDAAHEVALLLGGGLGAWWDDASFVVPDPADPQRLLAATIVNDHAGPLLTQVIVTPTARRQGLARALIASSLGAVRARTPAPLRLVVTVSNRRAATLYESLGFTPVPETLGGFWFTPAAFG